MALNVLLVLAFNVRIDQLPKLDKYYGMVIFPSTIISAAVAAHAGVYGNSTLWCWIMPAYGDLRLLLFYGPLWIMFAFNLAVYLWIGWTLYKSQNSLRLSLAKPDVGINSYFTATVNGRNSVDSTMMGQGHTAINMPRRGSAIDRVRESSFSKTGSIRRPSVDTRSRRRSSVAEAQNNDSRDRIRRYTSKVALFIVGFFITFAPASLNRILNLLGISQYGFFLAQALTEPLSGLTTTIIYFNRVWTRKSQPGSFLKPPSKEKSVNARVTPPVILLATAECSEA
ncbi:hypothetical protein SmJEL517_g02619 [Synchytrium microbalum]|uniref:G-protein coupled receptors family 2 profile 2 domain-containing protein n=1 Tax=Synchytrium microbalum TaxID=1806994 RepID=A0A507C5R4_9FUNG|nr:uncharacterized protein SmJEL517_g02619 [Synchytrium microbalum]TPX34841.1 hypothetical protein SmJEL517_g02619 [Synchytrium microbalum]